MANILDNYIIPEVWVDNLTFSIPERAKIFATGAVYKDPNPAFSGKGVFEHIPFSKEPTDDLEAPQKNNYLTATELEQSEDLMVCVTRQKDFRFSDTVIRRAGADYYQNLYNDLAEYIAKQYEKHALGILKAIFGPGGTLYSSHTVDSADPISFDTVFAGKQKLGDNAQQLAFGIFHSEMVNILRKKGMVEVRDIPNWKEQQINEGTLQKIAGMPIVETDLLNTVGTGANTKYFTYLLGNNSIYFANPHLSIKTWEDPRINGGDYHLVVTTDFCIHVPGVRYTLSNGSSIVKEPTNAQLFDPATWQKVADHNKDIKIVSLMTPGPAVA